MNVMKALLFLLIAILMSLTAIAQRASTPELALRVEMQERVWEIPAFNGGGGGSRDPKRLESWIPPPGQPAVSELNFKINCEADVVVTTVLVKLTNEKELVVGTYRLREGESVITQELSKVGLEPVVLRIVRNTRVEIEPTPPIQPRIENKTKSVEVANFYRDPELNNFRLTLQNISGKAIIAVDLYMPEKNGGSGQQSEGDRTHPVMTPAGTSDQFISVSRGGRTTANGVVPDPQIQKTLIIRAVVFEDGSYDGLASVAAEITGRRTGVNMQRKRILVLLEQITKEDAVTLDGLKERAYALNDDHDGSVIPGLISSFPSLSNKEKLFLTEYVKQGLLEGKRELLRDINHFEQNPGGGSRLTLTQWLEEMRTTYQKRIDSF
jgi:hypothetical protein